MSRRPAPLVVGPLRAAAIRGPRADGRWYWRARRYVDGAESCPWTGWASRVEAERQLAALGSTWRDQEHQKFAEEFEQQLLTFGRFAEATGDYVPYLIRKAERVEEYQQQR